MHFDSVYTNVAQLFVSLVIHDAESNGLCNQRGGDGAWGWERWWDEMDIINLGMVHFYEGIN